MAGKTPKTPRTASATLVVHKWSVTERKNVFLREYQVTVTKRGGFWVLKSRQLSFTPDGQVTKKSKDALGWYKFSLKNISPNLDETGTLP